MSRKTRSGFSRLIVAMADLPSPHSATISRSGSSSNRLRRRSRAKASSSLSNTRMGMAGADLLKIGAEGYVDFDDAASAGRILQGQAMILGVKLQQARPRIAQADAFRRNNAAEAGKALSVVANLHPQLVEDLAGGNADKSGRAAWADAVANRIFYQRLQNHVWNQCGKRVGRDVHLHLQAVLEARLLDVDVLLQHGQLAAEWDLMHSHRIERESEQVGELKRHVLGGRPVVACQRGDRVQGVEEEVRFQLDLQHFQLRQRQLSFKLGRLHFTLAVLGVIVDGLRDEQNVPIALEVHKRAR